MSVALVLLCFSTLSADAGSDLNSPGRSTEMIIGRREQICEHS